jgi:hypothetical protein
MRRQWGEESRKGRTAARPVNTAIRGGPHQWERALPYGREDRPAAATRCAVITAIWRWPVPAVAIHRVRGQCDDRNAGGACVGFQPPRRLPSAHDRQVQIHDSRLLKWRRELFCLRPEIEPGRRRWSSFVGVAIFARQRRGRYRAPGCVPLIAASVEICRQDNVICRAKEAVG